MTIKILILLISLTFYQLVTAYEDSIFLIFEDQVITKSDIQTNIGKNFSKKEVDQFINRIVDEKILIDNIKKFNIQPNEEYIETHLKQIAKENNLSTLDLISLQNFETIRENAIFLSQVENLIKIIINDPKEPNVSEIKQYIHDHPEITHWVSIDDLRMGKTGVDYGEVYEHEWGLDNFVETPKSTEGIKQTGIKEKILKFLINDIQDKETN